MSEESAKGDDDNGVAIDGAAPPAIGKKEKSAWRTSPFASKEIGLAANPPAFVASIPRAMGWDSRRNKEYLLGQLLASAIVHGALLCEHFWQPWLNGICGMGREHELFWVEIQTPDDENSEYRWFADPTTRSLLILWDTLGHTAEGASARDCLGQFLGALPGASQEQDDTISAFVKWAVMYWRLRVPPLLLDQALSRLPTVTMSNGTWLAVLGKLPRAEQPSGDVRKRSALGVKRQWLAHFNDKGSIESKIFEDGWQLRSRGILTRRQEKNFCARQLKAALPELSPGRQLLACWAIAGLTRFRPRPSPKGLAASTVRQRLCAILVGVYPDTYMSDDFGFPLAKLVQDVNKIADETESHLVKAAHEDFCAFLNTHGGVSVEEGEEEELEESLDLPVDEVINRPTHVSAKIVAPAVYDTAIGIARGYHNEQAALAIILGFRAGLRFTEISGLHVHDFVIRDKDIFELHVQHHRHRELKTFESRRIIPLDVLLTGRELDALRAWLHPRLQFALETKTNIYCFGPLGSKKPLADSQTYIEKILAQACRRCGIKDQSYTFAHLRHSFGSYLLATLLLPEDADKALLPTALKGVVCWERKEILSSRLLGEERLGRAALHAVSQIMGHTGVYRTLESYQHLLDFTLGLYVNRWALRPAFPPEVLASFRLGGPDECTDVMAAFAANKLRTSRRSRERSRDYNVPFPPKSLPSPLIMEDWQQLPSRLTRAGSIASEASAPPAAKWLSANYAPNVRRAAAASTSKLQSDWNFVWTILTSGGDETDKLRISVGLDNETLKKWQDRYRQILGWCFNRQTRRRDGSRALPGPLGADALWVVNRMWLNYSKALQSMRAPLLRTFLFNYDESAAHSRFAVEEEAIEFARFLRNVGVDGRDITIARGQARDLKDVKSGNLVASDRAGIEGIEFRSWSAPEAFLQKPRADPRFALWISHKKHEETSLGWRYDVAHLRRHSTRDPADGPAANNKVNYAYRFALAMMAIVSDEVGIDPLDPLVS